MSKKGMRNFIGVGVVAAIVLGVFLFMLPDKQVTASELKTMSMEGRVKLAEKNLKNFKNGGEEEVVINISFDNPLNIDDVFSLINEFNGETQSIGHVVTGEGNHIVGEFVDCKGKSHEDIKREYISQLSEMVDVQMENVDYRLKDIDKETNEDKDAQLKSLLDLKNKNDKLKADLDKGIVYIYGANVKVKWSAINSLKNKSSIKLIEILNCEDAEEVTPMNFCQ